MKKRLVKIMAGFLIFAMILSVVSPETAAIVGTNVAAAEEENQEVQENSTAITQKDIDQKSSETATEEKTDNLEKKETEQEKTGTANMPEEKNETNSTASTEKKDLEANKDSQQMEEKEEEKASSIAAGKINFVYIESPYLKTPGTQRIVIAFEKAISGIETLTLTVKDESGKKENWPLSKQKEGVYLFEKEYSSSAASGTYKAEKLNLIGEDNEETISLSNLDVQAEFGVNKEYDGIDELQPITNDESGEASASVAVIDENGTAKAQTSIAAALNEAQKETAGKAKIGAARSGKIIVALDPGHDANSIGAHANGLKEEELTLKIAKYCKEELEQYAGVEVYMTRTGAECPFDKASSDCIEDRVNAAADAGAQIFVSFHLNSFTSSSAKGAEVIIQNKNWRPAVASEGEKLASAILDELEKIGITKRATPIYSKNAVNNKKYADGSAADYYSVQRYSKLRNIPGIIVEHAFITNTEEVNKYLKTEAGLKKLGVADASGIAKYLGISKGEWRTDSKGNRYYYENGQKVIGEKKINGKWYYFDKKGIMKTGWHSFTNKKVYYGSDGAMVKGEKKINGKWYFFEYLTGAMKTGWHSFTNKKVYYGSDGVMVKGEKKIDGKWYYFEYLTGAMKTGWHSFTNKKVYYGSDGAMVKGEKKINGKWYYFEYLTGAMKTGWHSFTNKKVYYGNDGVMVKGEKKINGKWYYFEYLTGAMKTGWHSFTNKKVYYGSDGVMVKGEKKIDGKWYFFEYLTGAMKTGWHSFTNKKVYYGMDGAMVKGEKKIDGKWYLFKELTGAMVTGWYNFPNKRVYYESNGAMAKGETIINGKSYYFRESTGELLKNGFANHKYYGANGVLIPVSQYGNIFYKISGNSSTTIQQMVRFYEKHSSIKYPSEALKEGGAATIEDFARIYYEEAKAEGIKAEVAWAQTMKETGWLKFGGQVKIEQYNFAGIGATDGGACGASFEDVRTGVRAQIQHLKAYASTDELKQSCVDPRFDRIKRGCAQYVEILGQKENPNGYGWATSENYGVSISKLIDSLKKA